jgi:hypothetical protein
MSPLQIWSTSVLLALAASFAGAAEPTGLPDSLPEEFVVRAYYRDIEDINRLVAYDVWEYNNLEERYVLVALDRAGYRRLVADGWRLEVDAEGTSMIDRERLRGILDAYLGVEGVYARLDTVQATYPAIVEVVDYGDSYCKQIGGCVTLGGDPLAGYDLRAVRITNRAIAGPKPVFFLMANIHAREITTPELALRWIDQLTQGYGTNADITWMVDHQELWVVPLTNPDGRAIVDLGLLPQYGNSRFFQRKNSNRESGCNTWPPNSGSQYGIDLNRNHSFVWNTGGSDGQPCSQTFRGVAAASEVEVSALQALATPLIPDRRDDPLSAPAPLDTEGFFLTLHSFGNYVLRPWGTTAQPAPNETGLAAIGAKLATYNGYQSCQSNRCLYETSGTSDDWAYGNFGVPAFTFEIGNDFMPAYSVIDSTQWPQNGPAFLYAARIARTPYVLVNGPDARNLALTPLGANRMQLRAVIDDRRNGNAPIASAVYSIDQAYWQPGYTPHALQPVDGSANTPLEAFRGVINLAPLSPGRHTVYVRGVDAAGNAGPVSAIFLVKP